MPPRHYAVVIGYANEQEIVLRSGTSERLLMNDDPAWRGSAARVLTRDIAGDRRGNGLRRVGRCSRRSRYRDCSRRLRELRHAVLTASLRCSARQHRTQTGSPSEASRLTGACSSLRRIGSADNRGAARSGCAAAALVCGRSTERVPRAATSRPPFATGAVAAARVENPTRADAQSGDGLLEFLKMLMTLTSSRINNTTNTTPTRASTAARGSSGSGGRASAARRSGATAPRVARVDASDYSLAHGVPRQQSVDPLDRGGAIQL